MLSRLLYTAYILDKTLDSLKPVYGDPQVIEVELAKLKVSVNDIQAHQSSVDTLNDASRQIIKAEKVLGNLKPVSRVMETILWPVQGRLESLDGLAGADGEGLRRQDACPWGFGYCHWSR